MIPIPHKCVHQQWALWIQFNQWHCVDCMLTVTLQYNIQSIGRYIYETCTGRLYSGREFPTHDVRYYYAIYQLGTWPRQWSTDWSTRHDAGTTGCVVPQYVRGRVRGKPEHRPTIHWTLTRQVFLICMCITVWCGVFVCKALPLKWTGAVELEKLSLKKDAFRQQNLPLDIRTGVPLPL